MKQMRVIAGTARRIQLKTLDGIETRPTTDRIKETLFNMIDPYLEGCVFLDLFSGSGGIAIEALSRGAARAVLVERNADAIACIQDNLMRTHLADRAQVIKSDVFSTIKRLDGQIRFDYIFMDPPYRAGIEQDVLRALADSSLMNPDCVIIVEAALETDFSYVQALRYSVIRTKEYKTNKHLFLTYHTEDEIC